MKIELSKHAISLLKGGKFKKAIVAFIIDNDLCVSFQEGSGCDPFWLRRARKHEL